MTLPPPQDPFGSQTSRGGGPQWGGTPPQAPGAQPPYAGGGPAGHPQGAPQYGQQPAAPWQQQWTTPPPPPNKGGKGKWILIGLALVAVIAVSIVGTVLVLRPDSGGGNSQTSNTANGGSEFASANDAGPANIVTEDPTCDAWGRLYQDYLSATKASGWADRDSSIPATSWTLEQRTMYETMGKARTEAANKTVNLTTKTPHRVMRELYTQFIVYARLAVETIPNYIGEDNRLSGATDAFASAVANICSAIQVNTAQTLAPLVPAPALPSEVAAPEDSSVAGAFITSKDPRCAEFEPVMDKFEASTAEWRALDAKIPASEWTPEQRALNDAAGAAMAANADDLEQLGRDSANAVFEDIAVLAAQYRRAFVQAIPNYRPVDNYLSQSAVYLQATITWSCRAAS